MIFSLASGAYVGQAKPWLSERGPPAGSRSAQETVAVMPFSILSVAISSRRRTYVRLVQQVLGLDVAVRDTVAMAVQEPVCNLAHNVAGLGFGKDALLSDAVKQLAALDAGERERWATRKERKKREMTPPIQAYRHVLGDEDQLPRGRRRRGQGACRGSPCAEPCETSRTQMKTQIPLGAPSALVAVTASVTS